MERKNKNKPAKLSVKALAGAVAVIGILLVSFGQQLGLPIPGWEDIGTVTNVYESLDGDFSVHYLDVGKADAIYVNCGEYDILIDAGVDTTSREVNAYINKYGVTQLDLVVATHPDKDHIGGMANIIEDFEIDLFWMPELEEDIIPDSKVYQRMETALTQKDVLVEMPKTGESIVTDDLTIDVLSPGVFYNNTNDSSIVVKITYGKTKFLFMGDASKKVEKDLLESGASLSATVLKLGHHGSKTSSREEFLTAVNPEIGIISVGPDKNNLPNDEVLQRLEELTIPYYRTDIYGTVVVTSDGKDIAVETQK